MQYYSQTGQDEWVDDFFKQKENGYFIEVGAYDGIQLSNTYFFEKYRKWNGLCIEADNNTFLELKRNRTSLCLNNAISSKEEDTFFKNEGLCGKISSSGTKITTTTLKNIFQTNSIPKIIDYLSLDIEGHEYDALLGFPWETHEFILLTVEHNLYKDGDFNKNRIFNFLTKKGYYRIKDNINGGDTNSPKPYEDWYIKENYISKSF
jgi:FkbM family methyltransferase